MVRSKRYLASVWITAILCGIASSANGKVNLYDFCSGLARKLAANKEASTEAEAVFREAQSHFKSTLGFSKAPISKLEKAWETVIKDEPCDKNSGDHVTTIAKCNPPRDGSLATLFVAVKSYSNKCLTPAFWDKQLHKTLESSGHTSELTKFMDARFLEKYRKDNAAEQSLHFATIGGPNCCKAYRSHGALLQALEPILGGNGPEDTRELILGNRKLLKSALQTHLFKPCEKYVNTVVELMLQASIAAKYHEVDEQVFVDSLSQEFQDALFRFKYCGNFRYLANTDEKLNNINVNGFELSAERDS